MQKSGSSLQRERLKRTGQTGVAVKPENNPKPSGAQWQWGTRALFGLAVIVIPFTVPIAFGVLALASWRHDARARRAFEATLSVAEKRQLRALRRVDPLRWRAFIALKQAEAAALAWH